MNQCSFSGSGVNENALHDNDVRMCEFHELVL